MPCFFLYSCNEKVVRSTYDHFCKTAKRYIKCSIYKGSLTKQRPSQWNRLNGGTK